MEIFDLTGETPLKPKNNQIKTSPLKESNRNLISNLAKELEKAETPVKKKNSARSSSMPPPMSPKVVPTNTCPICERKFKNERGVKQHRARSAVCSVDKENIENNNDNVIEDSVIVIDTPPVPVDTRRKSLRRKK